MRRYTLIMNAQPIYTDDSLMPFGKHKGKRLGDVPADYLLFMWDKGVHEERGRSLHEYIKKNFRQLEKLSRDYLPEIANRPDRA